ncbi:LPS-assembly protein LptD [bacterium]|nr:MAG: LPS-assembly protein LptD [bacterium]
MPFAPSPQDVVKIKIEALRNYVQADHSVVYEGSVVVRYGLTVVTADRLTVFNDDERGVAEGRVTLIDPDGTARADRLDFKWTTGAQSGSGENVSVEINGARLKARRANILPGEWTLIDAEGTACGLQTPLYYITSEKIIVRPGESVTVREPRLSLLGNFIAELPTQRQSLGPSTPGLRIPTFAFSPSRGATARWAGSFVAGSNSVFSFNVRASESNSLRANAFFTHSFLPVGRAERPIAPRSDFLERFGYGFLDNVRVRNPQSESRYLRQPRSSLSFGGQINSGTQDRARGTRYDKLEAVYERGTVAGAYGFLGQARLQNIGERGEKLEPRLNLVGSMGVPSRQLSPKLSTLTRIDSQMFIGKTGYGWTRGMAGLVYQPTPWLRLSGGAFTSVEAGDPQLGIDPLFAKTGLLARGDLAFGGLRLSYLTKQGFGRGVYDHELSVRQIIGCVEVSYLARQYPRDRVIGLTLRMDPFIDLFNRRGWGKRDTTPGRNRNAGPVVK